MKSTPFCPNKWLFLILIACTLASSCKKGNEATQLSSYSIIGETIALSGENPSMLTKPHSLILKVYKLDANGLETVFKEGTDYITSGTAIMRTPTSKIPDFSTHKMILNSNGKFTWQPDPNRNPQLSLFWQVMVDYKTIKDSIIIANNDKISAGLRNKIVSGSKIAITCIGTSITAAAHTLPRYYQNSDTAGYAYLVARGLKKISGNNVLVTNLSEGGATTSLFTSKLPNIISSKPDIVFVEFGMNEHLIGADMDWNLSKMEAGIKLLRENEIDCILVGFFQQNPFWELESVESTVYFNNKLREMAARNNIYFSDIYRQFNQFSQEKLYRDLTGDFHHHPTEFAHKLYYLSIMPTLITTNKKESELLTAVQ